MPPSSSRSSGDPAKKGRGPCHALQDRPSFRLGSRLPQLQLEKLHHPLQPLHSSLGLLHQAEKTLPLATLGAIRPQFVQQGPATSRPRRQRAVAAQSQPVLGSSGARSAL